MSSNYLLLDWNQIPKETPIIRRVKQIGSTQLPCRSWQLQEERSCGGWHLAHAGPRPAGASFMGNPLLLSVLKMGDIPK